MPPDVPWTSFIGSARPSIARKRALEVDSLSDDVERCISRLEDLLDLPAGLDEATVHTALQFVEVKLPFISSQLDKLKHHSVQNAVTKAHSRVKLAQALVLDWRDRYPDLSPVKINNGAASMFNSLRAIAYSILLQWMHSVTLALHDMTPPRLPTPLPLFSVFLITRLSEPQISH